MSFNPIKLSTVSGQVKSGVAFQYFGYLSETDNQAIIIADGYFNEYREYFRRGDVILVLDTSGSSNISYFIRISSKPISGDIKTEVLSLSVASLEAITVNATTVNAVTVNSTTVNAELVDADSVDTPQIVTLGDLTIITGLNKTIVLDKPFYKDIQFPAATGRVPASNAPTWEPFTANTNAFGFGIGDYLDLQASELAHWWKEGTDADIHAHITTKAANNSGADQFVKVTVWAAYCNSGNESAWVETSFTAELTIPDGTDALTLLYLDVGNIDLEGYKIGGEVQLRIGRIAATGGVEYPGNIFITQAGAHLMGDTLGSRFEGVK